MKQLLFLISVAVFATNANAKMWRLNNNPGITADFSDPQTAVSSASVHNDDTLYFEASAVAYNGITLRKRLVLIGLGYFIDPAGNTGLQASTNNAKIGLLNYDSLASGSQFIGLEILSIYGQTLSAITPGNISLSAYATDNITITRCFINGDLNLSTSSSFPAEIKANGWKINKCYISGTAYIYGVNPGNWQITNCIFGGTLQMSNPNTFNCLIRNNFIPGANIYNAYIANNFIRYTLNRFNCTVKNNTSVNSTNVFTDATDLANGNNYEPDANVFIGGSIPDKYYQLNLSYEATTAANGETVNGVTVKRGPFGTADPYLLSGIPGIPSIYTLTVPASIASTATNMPITISTRSNN